MVHFKDGFLEVQDKLVPVVLGPGVEGEQDAARRLPHDLDAKVKDGRVEQRHLQAFQVEAVSVGIGRGAGALGLCDLFGHHQEVVEQEDVSLVAGRLMALLGLVDVEDFVEPAQADQPAVGLSQVDRKWLLAAAVVRGGRSDALLDHGCLGHVILTALELVLLDRLVLSSAK